MSMSHPHNPRFGLGIMYPAPGIIERIGPDWDWIWLDGQHGQIAGYDTMLAMVRACDHIARPAYLRVAGHEPGSISLALDMGAHGVIVPQVDTVDQAKGVVQAAKFPPIGNRSFGGRRPIDLHGREYFTRAPRLICQIESPEALEAAAAIASVPGVDGLFIGPDDLALRWGLPMNQSGSNPQLTEAIRHVAEQCRIRAKDCFCVAVTAANIELCASLGATHIVSGVDVGFLAQGSREASQAARQTAATPTGIKTAY